MKASLHTLALAIGLLIAAAASALAQVETREMPVSFGQAALRPTPTVTIQKPDVASWLQRDAAKDASFWRSSVPVTLNVDFFAKACQDTIAGRGVIYRLTFSADDALGLMFSYDKFLIPEGCRFFVYNADNLHTIGAFTAASSQASGRFVTRPVFGERVVLEFFRPLGVTETAQIHLSKAGYCFRGLSLFDFNTPQGVTFMNNAWQNGIAAVPGWKPEEERAALELDDAEEDATCHDEWCGQRRSVVRLIHPDAGGFLCSGAMVNNTKNDMTPYLLTASHCLQSQVMALDPAEFIVLFNYRSTACDSAQGPDHFQTTAGTTRMASGSGSDFALLRLSERPPGDYNVYLSGFDRSRTATTNGATIGHPLGNLEQISMYDDKPERVRKSLSDNECGGRSVDVWEVSFPDGISAMANSGAPLFDRDGQIIGQLSAVEEDRHRRDDDHDHFDHGHHYGWWDHDDRDHYNSHGHSCGDGHHCEGYRGSYHRWEDDNWNGHHWGGEHCDGRHAHHYHCDGRRGFGHCRHCHSEKIDAYFGRLDAAWEASSKPDGQLRTWLDPRNQGVTSLNGLDACTAAFVIQNTNTPETGAYQGIYAASGTVTAQNNVTVQAGTRVTFDAAQGVTLRAGFTASAGCSFTARTVGCTGGCGGRPVQANKQSNQTAEAEAQPDAQEILLHAAPNPFQGETTLQITQPADGMVQVTVFDQVGRKVMDRQVQCPAGMTEVPFRADGLTPGYYYAQLRTESGHTTSLKLALLR